MSKTVKIRIAVAVDAKGAWAAAGDSFSSSHDQLIDFTDDFPVANYWLTADVPIPIEPKTIEANVEPGNG